MKAREESKEASSTSMTIGQHFDFMASQSDRSLESRLYLLSNGEYEPNLPYEKRYPHWPELFRFCWGWVQAHRDGPYREWQTEADMMDWGMKRLADGRIKAPGAWLSVIKRLRKRAKELSK